MSTTTADEEGVVLKHEDDVSCRMIYQPTFAIICIPFQSQHILFSRPTTYTAHTLQTQTLSDDIVVLPTYHLKPNENQRFYPSKAKIIANEILQGELEGKVDEKWVEEWSDFGDEFETLSKDIADKIKEKCKSTMDIPRYKIVVQVTIGQMKDQGVKITSRCLWDTTTDNYATVSYQNQHIWASAIVFGLYADWIVLELV